jgi:hypothetical protein
MKVDIFVRGRVQEIWRECANVGIEWSWHESGFAMLNRRLPSHDDHLHRLQPYQFLGMWARDHSV